MQIFANFNWLEWIGVACTLLYNFLLMRENSWCWYFGIASSFLAVVVFAQSNLYGQILLNLFYAGMGFYGWWIWIKWQKTERHVIIWQLKTHLWVIVSGIILSFVISAALFDYTKSPFAFTDTLIVVFGFVATFKEARKVLSSWVYWFFINAASAWLYWQNQLYGYFLLMIIYTALSVAGYFAWKKIYEKHVVGS